MRALPTEIQQLLARRDGIIVHNLFLLSARNRSTNAMEQIGIWTGADHQVFTVEGNPYTFYGAGDFLSADTLKTDRGLNIRKLALNLSPFTPEVQKALMEYDPKMGPASMYLAFFDPLTNNMVANPWRVHKGWIDTAPMHQGAKGDKSYAILNVVGNTRILTRVFPAKRSDAAQKLRNAADVFFKYVGISGTVNTPWGTEK